MTNFRKIVSMLMVCTLLLGIFISCTNTNTDSDDTNNGNVETAATYDITGYTIVRPDLSGDDIKGVIALLRSEALDNIDTEFGVALDADEESKTEREIIIGETVREESIAALNELRSKTSKQAFIIKIFDKKIVIAGLSEKDTVIGVKHFITEFVNKSTTKGCIPATSGDIIAQKTGNVIAFTHDYNAIVVEHGSDIYKPTSALERVGFTYGKIVKLEHSGENNGILFATSEAADENPYPLFRSDDDGKTWVKVTNIYDSVNPGATLGYQPHIYELPKAMGKYPAGTLMFANCTRISGTTRMSVQASTDLGVTWEPIGNVAIGGSYVADPDNYGWKSNGLWEPILMYEEETERLYCFYSDELLDGEGDAHVGGHNQRLVYKYTTDLENWSDLREMVALEEAQFRPGMVALTRMGDGRYALAYEICARNPSGQIFIKYADRLDGWDPADMGKPVVTAGGASLATAPGIAWTPLGGECGTLIVVANRSWNENTGNMCAMFISSDYGETWIAIKNPIDVQKGDTGSGYSVGFFVDKDGYVYYVNNPQAFPTNDKFTFVKIKVF